MNGPLIVWLVSLGAVFLVGYAWGRASRRPVIVNFPELPPITRLKPTTSEVAAAMRATAADDEADR